MSLDQNNLDAKKVSDMSDQIDNLNQDVVSNKTLIKLGCSIYFLIWLIITTIIPVANGTMIAALTTTAGVSDFWVVASTIATFAVSFIITGITVAIGLIIVTIFLLMMSFAALLIFGGSKEKPEVEIPKKSTILITEEKQNINLHQEVLDED